MQDLHEIQIQILKELLFEPKLRYTDLRPSEDIENNKLNFHLNQLKEMGLIFKEDDYYVLTNQGKEFAGRLDTEDLKIKRQSKISVAICSIRNSSIGKEYLIYTRLKSPFYGCHGFITGKVDYGEMVAEAAKREFTEETGLTGVAKIVQLKHYHVFDKESKELLEDKLMFLSVIENPTGDLVQSEEGKYEWVERSKLKSYVTNHFESWNAFETQLKLIESYKDSDNIQFLEEDHYSEKF